MNLFILRHASAGTRRVNPLLDVKRPLDKEGKQQCLQLAHVLNALKINFDVVLSSPLKRALQTAQLVATETGYEQRIQLSPALAPEAEFPDFQHLLAEHSDCENILVVGHSPNIQGFAGSLLGKADSQPVPQLRMRKGTIVRLSLDPSPAQLLGLWDPRVIRACYTASTKSSRRKTSRK